MNPKPLIFPFILVLLLSSCTGNAATQKIRIATFNVAMGLETEGELSIRLAAGDDAALAKVAEILQRVRPDVVLLNEFDYSPGSADLLRKNYLEKSQSGLEIISYQAAFMAAVNTGVKSGLDFNNNGRTDDPEDAWGFGKFPGQYGMLVLSRFPIDRSNMRSFRHFQWADMPGALQPVKENGKSYYPQEIWRKIRLSSKNHWDLPLEIEGSVIHFLVSHPTPTVFDGPEDRNGRRNHDEIRIWSDYISAESSAYLVDDAGQWGGIEPGAAFVIAGDLNADPADGDWMVNSISQLLHNDEINASCVPNSAGGTETSISQAGINLKHQGDPATDTADFNDEFAGNLRVDYVLPSNGLKILGCGVYWPAAGETGHELVKVSDHRLVWLDISY